jgi:hypothetical protein
VGPDNGLFTFALEEAGAAVFELDRPEFWLPNISRTFHGRDIFAPVAAHLANGVLLGELGPALTDPVRLQMPAPEKTPAGWRAHITGVDQFGNLATNLPADLLAGHTCVTFRLCGREIRGLSAAYGDKEPGALVALVDSENHVEIAVVNGNAAQVLGARVGDVLEVVV